MIQAISNDTIYGVCVVFLPPTICFVFLLPLYPDYRLMVMLRIYIAFLSVIIGRM